MSAAFKVIDEQYVESFITGKSIRIGTLYDFRNEEKYSKGISDPNEGQATSHISSTKNMKGYEKALLNQDFKNLGLVSGLDVDLQFIDCSITLNHPNCYMFCTCMEMPDINKFNKTISDESQYNAVLRINDIKALADMLATALQRANLSSGRYLGQPVSYIDDDWDYLKLGMKTPNPFEKHVTFQNQNEHRLIFEANSNDIKVGFANFEPFPSGLVERVF